MSEQQVQNKIYIAIKKQHENAGIEVSVLNRCIDIAYFDNNKELITIEIKLKNWKQAIKQATDHQLYADRSYICLPKPHRKMSEDLRYSLEKLGIGLIWFEYKKETDKNIKLENPIVAQKNSFCWPPARKKIEKFLYV
jgi:hypothetical protein